MPGPDDPEYKECDGMAATGMQTTSRLTMSFSALKNLSKECQKLLPDSLRSPTEGQNEKTIV